MNRIERLAAILLLLQERPRTSGEIAQRFEVSRRTVLRDVQALSEMGAPVIAREGPGGGYSLPEDYHTAPLPLTRNEAFLLLLALGALDTLSALPFKRELVSLSSKLRALLPQGERAGAEGLLTAIQVQAPTRDLRAPFLEPLLQAAQAGAWLRAVYRSGERTTTQHLLPRQVYTQNGLWYCAAYSDERGEDRTYRVDRFLSVQPPGADFAPGPLRASVPYDDAAHPEISARLTPRGADRLESDPQLGPRLARDPAGGASLAFRCPPAELDFYARFFAGLGSEVEVLAPEEMRQKMRALGEGLVARYRVGVQ